MAIGGGIYLGSTLSLAFHLQFLLGLSALLAGVANLAMIATTILTAPLATRLFARFGARTIMAVGSLIAAAGMLYLSRLTEDGAYVSDALPGLLLIGFASRSSWSPCRTLRSPASPATTPVPHQPR